MADLGGRQWFALAPWGRRYLEELRLWEYGLRLEKPLPADFTPEPPKPGQFGQTTSTTEGAATRAATGLTRCALEGRNRSAYERQALTADLESAILAALYGARLRTR